MEKELNEAVAKARAVKKGMTTAVSVEFKTDKEAVMNADVKNKRRCAEGRWNGLAEA